MVIPSDLKSREIDEVLDILQKEAIEKDAIVERMIIQTRELDIANDTLKKSLEEADALKEEAIKAKEEERQAKLKAEKAREEIQNELVNVHQRTQTELMVTSVHRNYVLLGICLGVSIAIYMALVIFKHNDASAFGSTVQTIITLLVGFATGAIAQALGFHKAEKEMK
jgi:Fe2+ transport system protein B